MHGAGTAARCQRQRIGAGSVGGWGSCAGLAGRGLARECQQGAGQAARLLCGRLVLRGRRGWGCGRSRWGGLHTSHMQGCV